MKVDEKQGKGNERMNKAHLESVDFFEIAVHPEGDGYKALYSVNGDLIMDGDNYHDKIDDKIEGFLHGIAYCWNDLVLVRHDSIPSSDEEIEDGSAPFHGDWPDDLRTVWEKMGERYEKGCVWAYHSDGTQNEYLKALE
ncbi:MAG: hypothetical protein ACK52I_29575 [Pseudomonadota bacterium]